MIPVSRNSGTHFKLEGVYVTGSRYMLIHFYRIAVVEAGFYSDVVECLPVDPATWVRFPAGTGKIFLLYDTYISRNFFSFDLHSLLLLKNPNHFGTIHLACINKLMSIKRLFDPCDTNHLKLL